MPALFIAPVQHIDLEKFPLLTEIRKTTLVLKPHVVHKKLIRIVGKSESISDLLFY